MKVVDLDQTIFVPVVDEAHGGVTVEMKMTVGEFFARFCKGFEPEVVEAIPVAWLMKVFAEANEFPIPERETIVAIPYLVKRWQKEQEAR